MHRENRLPVIDRDEAIHSSRIEQVTPQLRAAVIGRQTRRQDQTDAPSATRQRQRALREELIQVRMAGAVERVDTAAASESCQPRTGVGARVPRAGRPQVAAQHFPGRVADNGIESRVRFPVARRLVKHLGEFELPVKEAVMRGCFYRGLEDRLGDVFRKRSSIEQRLECGAAQSLDIIREPRRHTRDPRPASSARPGRLQSSRHRTVVPSIGRDPAYLPALRAARHAT